MLHKPMDLGFDASEKAFLRRGSVQGHRGDRESAGSQLLGPACALALFAMLGLLMFTMFLSISAENTTEKSLRGSAQAEAVTEEFLARPMRIITGLGGRGIFATAQVGATFDVQTDHYPWVDPEAKSLIEGLLEPNPEKRLTASRALRHEWIRRRWRPPSGGSQVFDKIEDFCRAPLAKRLFGRFLARFLDAGHYLQIARSFYSLDNRGTGTLDLKELQLAARKSNSAPDAAEKVFDWLATSHHCSEISLSRFAETMAEEVIDGRALRHAFESLDDDGSEQVTPQELYDELKDLDSSITIEDVVKHVEAAELEIEDSEDEEENTKDHAIDYTEFMQLFPVRVERVRQLKERLLSSEDHSKELCQHLEDVTPAVERWLRSMETATLTIQDLASKIVDPRHADTMME
ncbi:CPK13, partial [Symbiodinium sp. KB8]